MIILGPCRKDVRHVAFRPDGRTLLVPSQTKGLLVWDVAVGGKPRILKAAGEDRYFGPVYFSADSRFVTYQNSHDRVICSLNDTELRRVALGASGDHGIRAAFVPDTSFVLVWELIEKTHTGPWSGTVTQMALRTLTAPQSEAAKWSLQVPRIVTAYTPLFPRKGEVVTLEWDEFIVGLRLVARDLATGRELRTSPPDPSRDTFASAAAHGLVAKTKHHLIKIWRDDDLSVPFATVTNETPQHFTGIAFHPSGRYLAATSNDETVKLYDTTSWEVARTFTWDIGRMRSIAFSPDGTLAAAGSDKGKVVVWDVDL
jgi:WD40 repeat protein